VSAPVFTVVFGALTVHLVVGDLAAVRADALFNSATSALTVGGGVDRALRRAGGRAYVEGLEALREETGGCRVGDALLGAAGALLAEMVVHVVSPRWRGGSHGEAALLERALLRGLSLAKEAGARTVALPALGTGAFGVPHAESAAATRAALCACAGLDTAWVVLADAEALAAWREVFASA